jgi:hypothetical protein
MLIKNLFLPWRQNVALHVSLETKVVTQIDHKSRELVQLETAPAEANTIKSQLKFRGKTRDGIEVYVDIELIGPSSMLKQFQFTEGKHVGLVLRAID